MDVLDDDGLLAARAKALNREEPLLVGGHQPADCIGKTGGLDVHPLAFLTSHVSEVVQTTVQIG